MGRIVVVTAVRPETRAALAALSGVRRVRGAERSRWRGYAGAHEVEVVQTGIGGAGAARALDRLELFVDLVVSLGFAGALRKGPIAGDLVLPEAVVRADGSAERIAIAPVLVAALAVAGADVPGGNTVRGTLLTVPAMLATPAEKEAAGGRFNAVAVEMECADVARYAADRGVRFLPLRVILDPLELSLAGLPPDLDASWRARTRAALAPGTWPLLAVLARHAARAGATLTTVARRLFPALATLR